MSVLEALRRWIETEFESLDISVQFMVPLLLGTPGIAVPYMKPKLKEGGDPTNEDDWTCLPTAHSVIPIRASRAGVTTQINIIVNLLDYQEEDIKKSVQTALLSAHEAL